MRRLGRVLLRIIAGSIVLAAMLALAAVLVFRSGWFHEKVHERMVREIEQATGARVDIGNFSFDWRRLDATVGPLVLHGKESPNEPPFVSAESVHVGLRVISMMERKVDLSSLRIDQPHVRIVFYPDGSNNIPDPATHHPETTWSQDLVHLAVGRYEVNNGIFEYDDRQIPLNLRGEDLRLRMHLDKPGRYLGELDSD